MQNDIERLLKTLSLAQPPKDMFERIVSAKRDRARLKWVKIQAASFGAGAMTLAAAMSIYWNMFLDELVKSSFLDYAQVVLTDYDMALLHWKSVLYGLAETLPLANLMAWSLMAFLLCGLANAVFKMGFKFKTRSSALLA